MSSKVEKSDKFEGKEELTTESKQNRYTRFMEKWPKFRMYNSMSYFFSLY
jgi:hypothetical protein